MTTRLHPTLPPPSHLDGVQCFSTNRAAELLDISERSVRRLVADGELDTVVILSKHRIPLASLRAYVERQAGRGRVRAVRTPA